MTKYIPWVNKVLDKRFKYVQLELLPEYLRTSKVVAVSRYLAKAFEKYTNLNAEVIYNGMEFKMLSFDEETWSRKVGISYLGGKRVEKGYNIIKKLVHSIALTNTMKDVVLNIRDNERDFIRYSKALKILVKNFFENVEEIYQKSFLVLLPSLCPESLSYTSIEALGYGSLVLAFNVGGLPEVIEDQKLLVHYGDTEEYIRRVFDIWEHKEEYFDVTVKHIERVRKKFSLENMVKRYIDLYERVTR